MASEPKLIKICLTNQGEDTETPWAHDLGPAQGPSGSRKVKLVNVPFMHAKPTWGDTIVVSPVPEGFPTWDRGGIKWNQISSRIVEDGGRWAMIVDYAPHDGVSATDAVAALAKACDVERLVCEGAWGPREADPGRVYLAVPKELAAEAVMERLVGASLPLRLIQVHPEPKRLPRAQTVVGVTPVVPRKPARAKTEKPDVAPPKPVAKAKPAAKAAHAAKVAPAPKAKAVPAAKAKPAAKAAPVAKSKVAAKPKAVPAAKAKVAAKAKAAPAAKAKPAAKKPAAKKR